MFYRLAPRRQREWPSVPMAVLVALSVVAPGAQAQEIGTIRATGAQARLRLEEVLSIGSLAGDDDAFGRVMAVAMDGRGRILVADDLAHHFKVFEASGAHLATVGSKGEGPGEFESPWGIAAGTGDSVFVWDSDRSRVSVFSPRYDWVRDTRVSPAWQVNSMVPRSDGTMVVAAFGRGDSFPVKVLNFEGTVLQEAGVPVRARNLYGFEDSLLGGNLARSMSGYVHAAKSPFVLSFLDEELNLVRICRGGRELTTDPADVVIATDRGVGLRWNEYVHTVSILPLGNGLFLATILDPGSDRRTLHVISEECRLVAELEINAPITPEATRGELLAAVRKLDYPEVVIYRVSLEATVRVNTGTSPASDRGGRHALRLRPAPAAIHLRFTRPGDRDSARRRKGRTHALGPPGRGAVPVGVRAAADPRRRGAAGTAHSAAGVLLGRRRPFQMGGHPGLLAEEGTPRLDGRQPLEPGRFRGHGPLRRTRGIRRHWHERPG